MHRRNQQLILCTISSAEDMLNLFEGRSKPTTDTSSLATDASGVPLELIRYDAGTFQLGDQALAALRKVKTPIGVVSVCGRARQGKSFILNQLLGTAGGFQVGPTVRPCTKGLWMWSSPVKRAAPDGSTYHLVCNKILLLSSIKLHLSQMPFQGRLRRCVHVSRCTGAAGYRGCGRL